MNGHHSESYFLEAETSHKYVLEHILAAASKFGLTVDMCRNFCITVESSPYEQGYLVRHIGRERDWPEDLPSSFWGRR